MDKANMKLWLGRKYPCTIVGDRYGGLYSKGRFVAFPLLFDEVPIAVDGDDTQCADFWADYEEPYGVGESPDKAYWNLVDEIRKAYRAESDNIGMELKLEKSWIRTPIEDGKIYVIGFNKNRTICGIGEKNSINIEEFSESFQDVYTDCQLVSEDEYYYYMHFKSYKASKMNSY